MEPDSLPPSFLSSGPPSLRVVSFGICSRATSRERKGHRAMRWHELELWRDQRSGPDPSQLHCVVIRYVTAGDGERGTSQAHVLPRVKLREFLQNCEPPGLGEPTPGDGQRNPLGGEVVADLMLGWNSAVRALLGKAGLLYGEPAP